MNREIYISGRYEEITFTAPETGNYRFYSISTGSGGDPRIKLYNPQDLSNQIAYDDDGGGNLQFDLTYELTKGRTVLIRLEHYGDSANFNFYIVKN